MDKQPTEKQSARTRNSKTNAESIKKNQTPAVKRARHTQGEVVAPGGLPLDISASLKPPMLPNVNPDAISHDQAHAGVTVHIPGSAQMRCDDVIVFYWGLHKSVSSLYQDAAENSVVRVLCITYHFLPHAQYGLVDLYYQVQRCGIVIGTSPVLKVMVNYSSPTTPKQRQRKRSVSRRYPAS